jgi:tetratricopeptide (TPR) repeat protein
LALKRNGDNTEALEQYRRAQIKFEDLVASFSDYPTYHSELAVVLHGIAELLPAAESLPMYQRAVQEQQKAVDMAPSDRAYRSRLRDHLVLMSAALIDESDYRNATNVIPQFVELADREMDILTAVTYFQH